VDLVFTLGRTVLACVLYIGLQNVAVLLLLELCWKQERLLMNLPFMMQQHPFCSEQLRAKK
jgi:hypothetical protein